MTIKKLLTVCLFAATAGTVGATDLYVYSLTNPTPVKQLNSFRSVEFGNTAITVRQYSGSTTTINLADFDFLKFSPATIVTGIGTVKQGDAEAKVSVENGIVKVYGGEIAGMYAADGRQLAPAGKALTEAALPAAEHHGIYIVKVKTATGTKTYKITSGTGSCSPDTKKKKTDKCISKPQPTVKATHLTWKTSGTPAAKKKEVSYVSPRINVH